MKFPDLRSFLAELEHQGELVRVVAELSPRHEAAAAIKLLAQREGKAVLLENIRGYSVPVVGNLLGSTRRLAIALGVKEAGLTAAYLEGRNKPIKPDIVSGGPVQEVVIARDIDILKTIPVLTHHEKDAGPYFTCAFVAARDPVSGIRGLGIHRIQVKGPDKVGIFLASPPLATFLAKAEKQKKPLEIAIVCGVDPVLYFASPQYVPRGWINTTSPGDWPGRRWSWSGAKRWMWRCPPGPSSSWRGTSSPGSGRKKAPSGSRYYLTYPNPVARITTITHRASPVYHALVPFGGEEIVLQFPGYQTDVLVRLQTRLPFVRQVHSPALGVVYVQIEKRSNQDPSEIVKELFPYGKAPYAKVVVVMDQDVDILNPREVAWALGTRVRPDKDLVVKKNLPGLAIDPSTSGTEERGELSQLQTRTAKLGIDATVPMGEEENYRKVDVPPEVRAKVRRLLGLAEM